MRSLSELSVRSLRRRPARFALTGAGAALGVAVLYAVLLTSAATTAALDDAVSGSAGDVDVFVGPVGSFDATLAPALVDQVAALDGVETAVGSVTFRSSAWPVTEGTAPPVVSRDNVLYVVGADLDRAQDLRSFDLLEGALPAPEADEIVLARRIADDLDLATGDTIALATPGGSQVVTISGILSAEGAGLGFQGAVGYTSTATAQRLFGKGDVITGVEIALADGLDSDTWIDDHREAIGESLTIQDADDAAAPFRDFITAISGALTLMSVIAVFVGGFLVFLTFSVAVAERTPTYGILRALGAQPAQVRRVVLTEAAVLGLVASLVGLIIGRLIAGVSLGRGRVAPRPRPAAARPPSRAGLGRRGGRGLGQRRGGLAPGSPGLRARPRRRDAGGRRRHRTPRPVASPSGPARPGDRGRVQRDERSRARSRGHPRPARVGAARPVRAAARGSGRRRPDLPPCPRHRARSRSCTW